MADLREVEVFRDIPPEMSVEQFLGTPAVAGRAGAHDREKRWDVYPYSESSSDFRKRTVNAIEGIIATNEAKRVVIACHGGVINAYIGHHRGRLRHVLPPGAHLGKRDTGRAQRRPVAALTRRRASPHRRR